MSSSSALKEVEVFQELNDMNGSQYFVTGFTVTINGTIPAYRPLEEVNEFIKSIVGKEEKGESA